MDGLAFDRESCGLSVKLHSGADTPQAAPSSEDLLREHRALARALYAAESSGRAYELLGSCEQGRTILAAVGDAGAEPDTDGSTVHVEHEGAVYRVILTENVT